jgi:hypothetical protein
MNPNIESLLSVNLFTSLIFNPINLDFSGIRISVIYSSIEKCTPEPGFLNDSLGINLQS